MSELIINQTVYQIIDTKEKITIADSFVKPRNKIMRGNGEAKLYVGNDNEETREFFGAPGFSINAFLLKKDLLKYLNDTEAEYKNPQQPYRHKNSMPEFWERRFNYVKTLPEIIWFTVSEQTQIEGPRVYVKSEETAYDLIRELSLPFITYLAAIKLRNPEGQDIYYFRLFVDYFGEAEHPAAIQQEQIKVEEENLPVEQKIDISYARIGQGKYRRALLEQCPFCPITMVTDDRLLIASHIKPWVSSNDDEKTDPKNGFMFTPTYDFLFDRGYISFTNDKRMLVSPWLSKVTCSKLGIADEKFITMLPSEGRENYLEYHRVNIFKS